MQLELERERDPLLRRNLKRKSLKVAIEVNILIFLKPNVLIVKRWDTLPEIVESKEENSKEGSMHLLLIQKMNLQARGKRTPPLNKSKGQNTFSFQPSLVLLPKILKLDWWIVALPNI